MILNDLNWAEKSLKKVNDPEWTQMSLNKPKWA